MTSLSLHLSLHSSLCLFIIGFLSCTLLSSSSPLTSGLLSCLTHNPDSDMPHFTQHLSSSSCSPLLYTVPHHHSIHPSITHPTAHPTSFPYLNNDHQSPLPFTHQSSLHLSVRGCCDRTGADGSGGTDPTPNPHAPLFTNSAWAFSCWHHSVWP